MTKEILSDQKQMNCHQINGMRVAIATNTLELNYDDKSDLNYFYLYRSTKSSQYIGGLLWH